MSAYTDIELYAINAALEGRDDLWEGLPFNGQLRSTLDTLKAAGPQAKLTYAKALAVTMPPEDIHRMYGMDLANPPALPEVPAASTVETGATPLPVHCTDLGNALRLVGQHGANLRYVHQWRQWFCWDSSRWLKDSTGAIYRLAKDTAISIYAEAAAIKGDDDAAKAQREALAAWAAKSESRSRIEAMVELGWSEPGIAILHDRLDSNHWLLNCANGTLDLQAQTFREHRRDDLITRRLDVIYNPDARCPTWRRFLSEIMCGDDELIEFLRRAVGYTLTGSTEEESLFFMYGVGRNGKTTFIETISRLLGDYALKTPTETLMSRQQGAPTNDIARLKGARLVVAAETEEGRRLNESLVKDLTSNDTITARFLYSDLFEFRPTHKLWVYGNHKPVIRGTDEGIWRRIKVIPFKVVIPADKRDPHLLEKLEAERPGILAWAVQGCYAWQRDGLTHPRAVAAATQVYRSEMDVLGLWLEDSCITGGPDVKVAAADLYASYAAWCQANGEMPVSQKRLGMALADRGYQSAKGSGGIRQWQGLGLVARKEAPQW